MHESHSSVAIPAGTRRTAPNLALLDLNLLRVFDALHEERSVTKAGSRLGVTQSAVSHALHRLREMLDDELFHKTTEGMVPTPKARAIGPRLHAALASLQTALAEGRFDPARATHCFTIAADPYARAIILPRAIARIRMEAPLVELRIHPGTAGATESLDSGRLDIAIASYRRIPDRFGVTDLLTDHHVWAMRADHPAAQQPLTLERLAAIPQLVRMLNDDLDGDGAPLHMGRGLERRAIQDDDGALMRALSATGHERQVRLTIPDSYTAMAVVGETDMAALVPLRMGEMMASRFNLALFEPPYESPPVPISMVWHQTHGDSAAARWLRAIIQTTAAGL